MREMCSRVVFVGCTLTLLGGCSFLVSTSGLAEDAAVDGGGVDAPATDAPSGDVDGPADAGVPDGQVVWPANGHRYEVRVYPTDTSWTEARDDAEASGGHLVTITSAAEGAFVGALVYARGDAFVQASGPWIGAHQPNPTPAIEPDGGWTWVTGEPWSYDEWRPTEPNNNGADEHFAHYSITGDDEGWNDIDVSPGDIRSAVIEYE